MRKPDFGGVQPGKTRTDLFSWSLRILDMAFIGYILSSRRTTQMLIRLHRCAGLCAPLLFVSGIKQVLS